MPTAFVQEIYRITREIPRGKVMSYGQIALLCGHPRGARAVGAALSAAPSGLPCHRVVSQDGSLCKTGAFGGEQIQRQMLEEEGIVFTPQGKIPMGLYLYFPPAFQDSQP